MYQRMSLVWSFTSLGFRLSMHVVQMFANTCELCSMILHLSLLLFLFGLLNYNSVIYVWHKALRSGCHFHFP
ncbi:hypothetical protein QL093DRAFT_2258645 [Fusarium oxysporum]|nr:hypothetical protein QL093DRAFT_2258645 [Fusarium oxysporum]